MRSTYVKDGGDDVSDFLDGENSTPERKNATNGICSKGLDVGYRAGDDIADLHDQASEDINLDIDRDHGS